MISGNPLSFSLTELISRVPSDFWWLVLVVFALLYLLGSYVLLYHWKKYSLHSPATEKVSIVYLSGLLAILILAGIMLALYTS